MRSILAIALVSVSLTASASTGLKTLRCDPVLGPVYEVAVSGENLTLSKKRWRNESDFKLVTSARHAFPLTHCKIEAFGVNLQCRDPKSSATLQVVLSKETSKVSGDYHAVEFRVVGVPRIPSARFETVRVEMGKSSRCYLNDVFEIR